MKTSIIISLFCLGSYAGFTQDVDMERRAIHERAKEIYCRTNGNMGPNTIMHYKTDYSNVHHTYPDAPLNAQPVWSTGNAFVAKEPPCYRYKNSDGRWTTECPGVQTDPKQCELTMSVNDTMNGNFSASRQGTYSGYYPNLHSIYPQAPANARAAWPNGPYTELKNPPCYKYINKKGLEVTECPGARFEPEHSR